VEVQEAKQEKEEAEEREGSPTAAQAQNDAGERETEAMAE
jgi:hypothetical protein